MLERRKFVRAGVESNIRWTRDVAVLEKEAEHKDITKNISGGGVCIITPEKLEPNERLLLEIDLPTGEIIRSRAKVVWTSKFEFKGGRLETGYETGVEFLDISEHDRELVEKFVFEYLRYPEKYR